MLINEICKNCQSTSIRRRFAATSLLVFGNLAFAPSADCGLSLLTKRGLGRLTAPLFVHRWRDDGCAAFDVFDALPMHKLSLVYSRPITTRHNALLADFYSKAAGDGEGRRLCLIAPDDFLCR